MKFRLFIIFSLLFSLVACTDYAGQIDERIEEYDEYEKALIESSIPIAEVQVDPTSVYFGTLEDERDGHIYKTVTIGALTWMAENLNYETSDKYGGVGSFCYDDKEDNCNQYGCLYTWATAMDSAGAFGPNGKDCGYGKRCAPTYPVRGVCPEGWHLPSSGEWSTLLYAVDRDKYMVSGPKLKSKSGWVNDTTDVGEDEYGFSVLPAGEKMFNGKYYRKGSDAYFWTATDVYREYAENLHIAIDGSVSMGAGEGMGEKNYANSVRCVKDVTDKKTEKDSSGQTPESSNSGDIEETERSSSSVESSFSSIEYGTLVDSRDDRTYKTVTIGTQVWMAENLNYDAQYSICRDDPDDCEKYGRYYTWAIAMDSAGEFSDNGLGCGYDTICEPTYPVRGICPEGWHLPRGSEYWTLIETVGGESAAAEKLKSTSGWDYFENGVDTYGFNILPAGGCGYDGCGDVGGSATFWTSDGQKESELSGIFGLEADYGLAYTTDESRYHAFSVRCVKD